MGFYDDLERSLTEAIQMEKGNIPMKLKEDMPAPTYVPDTDRNMKNIRENMK